MPRATTTTAKTSSTPPTPTAKTSSTPPKKKTAARTTAPPLFLTIRALDPDQLIDVGSGEYTATVGACGLLRDDRTPSQAGDVLSVQEDGSQQTRPAGTAGPFERCAKTGAGAVYRPKGKGGIVVIIPLAQDAPNK
jgi:hypothetical protein